MSRILGILGVLLVGEGSRSRFKFLSGSGGAKVHLKLAAAYWFFADPSSPKAGNPFERILKTRVCSFEK